MPDNPYTLNVAAGIGLLAAHEEPDWRSKISLTTFDVENAYQCPLGQLHGSYPDGRRFYDLDSDGAARYGFTVPLEMMEDPKQWALLNQAWIEALRA